MRLAGSLKLHGRDSLQVSQKEIDQKTGDTVRAWWDINELDPEGNILDGSEAWVVVQVYHWIGIENQKGSKSSRPGTEASEAIQRREAIKRN